MIISPTKVEDQRFLSHLYEELERAVKNRRLEYAKSIGETILLLKEKIAAKDYTEDDKSKARLAVMERHLKEIRNGTHNPKEKRFWELLRN